MCKVTQTAVILLFLFASWAAFAEPLNINAADASTIAQVMDGVGRAKAEAIVAYRKMYGDFKRIEDLVNVKGIGKKTVEKNQSKLTIGYSGK